MNMNISFSQFALLVKNDSCFLLDVWKMVNDYKKNQPENRQRATLEIEAAAKRFARDPNLSKISAIKKLRDFTMQHPRGNFDYGDAECISLFDAKRLIEKYIP